MNLSNSDLKKYVRNVYAWPGGYEVYAITSDGGCLCMACVRANWRSVVWSRLHRVSDGWQVVAVECDSNLDSAVFCDRCGKAIGPAWYPENE